MKKIILSGVIAGVAMLFVSVIVSFGSNYLFPGIKNEYNNLNLFRSMSDPKMQLFVFAPFITAFLLSFFYTKFNGFIKTNSNFLKGIFLGIGYWLFTIPGIFMEYTTFPVTVAISLNWSVSVLIQGICGGIIIAYFLKPKIEKTNNENL